MSNNSIPFLQLENHYLHLLECCVEAEDEYRFRCPAATETEEERQAYRAELIDPLDRAYGVAVFYHNLLNF